MTDGRMGHSVQAIALADILDRVLDKGVVIAGDVMISLVGVELLNIRLRLLICSVDKALEIGINWWENDPHLTTRVAERVKENQVLQDRVERLEKLLEQAAGEAS